MNRKVRPSLKKRAIHWSAVARTDIVAIYDYIARDNPQAAEKWIEKIFAAIEQAAEMPLSGRIVPEFQQDKIREVIRGRYRLVYLISDNVINVLTVFEGHRLFPKWAVDCEIE